MIDRADEITAELVLRPLIMGLVLAIIFGLLSSFTFGSSFGKARISFFRRLAIHTKRLVILSMPIVMLGYVSGYLTGISRAAAVGNLIPAALTLVGALTIYMFKARAGNLASGASYSVFMFGLSIFYGIQVGAFEREYRQIDRFIVLSEQERKVRDFRSNLDLPVDPPSWITGAPKE